MSTEHPESDVAADDLLAEPEAQPDTVRPTDDSEDMAKEITREEIDRRPQGD